MTNHQSAVKILPDFVAIYMFVCRDRSRMTNNLQLLNPYLLIRYEFGYKEMHLYSLILFLLQLINHYFGSNFCTFYLSVCNIILFLDFFPIFLFRNQLLTYPDAFKLQVCMYVHWYIKLAYLVLNRSLISDVIICYSMYFLIVTPLL